MIKILKNDKLKKILLERGELVAKGRKIAEQKEELDKDLKKIAYKLNRLKDKTVPLMEKEKIELDEFNMISRVFVKHDEVNVEIVDQIEEYKKALKDKQNEEAKNSGDNSSNK